MTQNVATLQKQQRNSTKQNLTLYEAERVFLQLAAHISKQLRRTLLRRRAKSQKVAEPNGDFKFSPKSLSSGTFHLADQAGKQTPTSQYW